MALSLIKTNSIAASAVTSAKIADGAITNADINNTAAIAQAKLAAIAADALSGNVIDGGTISNFASTGIDDNADALAVTTWIEFCEPCGNKKNTPTIYRRWR